MANVKTAVSLQKSLFEQIESLARKKKVSRSRLFAIALEDYLQRQQNQHLLEQLNQAYQLPPDAGQLKRLTKLRRLHRKTVEGEW